jgi:hypothetical protein
MPPTLTGEVPSPKVRDVDGVVVTLGLLLAWFGLGVLTVLYGSRRQRATLSSDGTTVISQSGSMGSWYVRFWSAETGRPA